MTRVARQSIIPHPIYLSIAEFHANSTWTILFFKLLFNNFSLSRDISLRIFIGPCGVNK